MFDVFFKIELSENVVKITNPDIKDIYRVYGKKTGKVEGDVICLNNEPRKDGKLIYNLPRLAEIKAYLAKELESFWDEYKRLDKLHLYKVDLSDEIKRSMLEKIMNFKV